MLEIVYVVPFESIIAFKSNHIGFQQLILYIIFQLFRPRLKALWENKILLSKNLLSYYNTRKLHLYNS